MIHTTAFNRKKLNMGLAQGRKTYEAGYPDAEYYCEDGCTEWHLVVSPCDCNLDED